MKLSNVSISGNVSLTQYGNRTCIQMDTVTINVYMDKKVTVSCSAPNGKIPQQARLHADIGGLGTLVVAVGIVYLDGRIIYPQELAPEIPPPTEAEASGSPPLSVWGKIKSLLGLP